jgi:hypothetical protein
VLRAQGADVSYAANLKQIVPVNPIQVNGFMVGSWNFGVANVPGAPAGYTNRNQVTGPNVADYVQLVGTTWQYSWVTANVTYGTPLRGQNQANTPGLFVNHFIVQIGSTLYDPSYGTTYSSLDDFVNRVVTGYWGMIPARVPGVPTYMLFQRPGRQSLRLVPG